MKQIELTGQLTQYKNIKRISRIFHKMLKIVWSHNTNLCFILLWPERGKVPSSYICTPITLLRSIYLLYISLLITLYQLYNYIIKYKSTINNKTDNSIFIGMHLELRQVSQITEFKRKPKWSMVNKKVEGIWSTLAYGIQHFTVASLSGHGCARTPHSSF